MASLLLVKDVMTTDVKTVSAESFVLEAVREMNKFRIGCIVVVEEGRPVGILTQADILSRIVEKTRNPETTKVRDVMSTPLHTTSPNSTVEDATRKMTKLNVKRLVVVDQNKLAGILTATDLTKNFYRLMGLLEEFVRARYVPSQLRDHWL